MALAMGLLAATLTVLGGIFLWLVKSTGSTRTHVDAELVKVYKAISDQIGSVNERLGQFTTHIAKEELILEQMSERFHTLAATLERQATTQDETREMARATREAAVILGMRMDSAEGSIKELQRRDT